MTTTLDRPPRHAVESMLTTADVVRITRIPAKTLANWRYLGRGPAYIKDGHCVRYPSRALQAWLDQRTVHPHD